MVIEDEEVVQIQKELVDLNIGVKAIIQVSVIYNILSIY